MVKIEVRQNRKFDLGFPYNDSVDDYFKNLDTSFVSNYGLDTATVLEINNHKNDTLQFDRDLHEYILKLSAFITGFETSGQIIIDEFEDLVRIKTELEKQNNGFLDSKLTTQKEFDFVLSNITDINENIDKLNELISFYDGQIIDETYSYNDTYIEDTELDLMLINDVIITVDNDFEYYKDTLYTHIEKLSSAKIEILNYTYHAVTLRSMYEEWRKRKETHYINLVAQFKDEYESMWTYGSSLMFGEKEEVLDREMHIYKDIAGRWQSSLFRRYKFSMEKELKEFSLNWLSGREHFDEKEFVYVVERKKVELLEAIIRDVEDLIIDKRLAIKSIIATDKEKNYLKYREAVTMKMKHISDSIGGEVDQNVLDDYDTQMEDLYGDYNEINLKLTKPLYWQLYSDWEMHTELLTDLQRQLDKSLLAISREFKKDVAENEEFVRKVEFYTSEKEDLEMKIDELRNLKEKLEIDNNVYKDELTILESQLIENKILLDRKRYEYMTYFDGRITFFTQNVEVDVNDGIIELLNGNFYRDFDDKYDEFKNYYSSVEWYVVDDREKLKKLYSVMLEMIHTNMSIEWEREFSHDIMDIKKIDVYEYYFNREIRNLYATIHFYLSETTHEEVKLNEIKSYSEKVKEIFSEYVKIAFNLNVNVKANVNLFDYNDIFEFDIENGRETKQNILKTFSDIMDDIIVFVCNKSIEFSVIADAIDKKERINRVWLDMEKSYV